MADAALRTLAHPLRSRLVGHLRAHGPATATELAAALGTNTGATSYHLRRLEDAGLVADAGTGTGRRRVWEVAAETGRDDIAADPEDEDDLAAADWLARDYLDHFTSQATRWLDHRHDWSALWQESLGLEDHEVLVTEEQAAALRAEVLEVLARYRRLGQGNPQAKRVAFYTCPLPVTPPLRTPRSSPRW